MAGPLTWRNVDSPDFRGAARGYEASAALLGNAFDSASKGLAAFQTDRQNTADQSVLSGLAKISDPKAFQDAVNSTDLSGVSKQGLAAIGSRAGQLLQQASTQQEMGIKDYNQNRAVREDGFDDAARPVVAGLFQAAQNGDRAAMQQIASDPRLANLSTKEQQALFTGAQGNESSALNNVNRRFQNATQLRDDIYNQEGIKQADWVQRTTDPNDQVGVQAALDQITNPNVKAQALKQMGYNAYAPGRTPAAGGGGRATGAIGSAVGAGSGGTFDSAIIQESRGRQFDDNGNVLTSPKGALGIAQIMPKTAPEAAKLAGLPYDENRLKNDPEYNASLGRAYYNEQLKNFGGDEQKALAAYNAGPQATKDAIAKAEKAGNPDGWLDNLSAETRNYVPQIQARAAGNQDTTSQFAVGNDQVRRPRSSQFGENADDVAAPTVSGMEVKAANIGVQDRLNQNQSQGISADLQAALQSTDSQGKVVNDLLASDFSAADRGKLTSRITEIMRKTGSGAAVAGAILRRNQSAASGIPFTRDFSGTTDLGGGVGFNDNGIETDINLVKTGAVQDQVLSNDMTKAVSQNIDSAKQGVTDAQAELTAWNALAARRPSLTDNDQSMRLTAKLNKAQEKLQDAVDKQRQEPAFASRRTRPKPPEEKNREMNIPDPKSLAQTVDARLLPRDFGLYD